MKKKKWKHPELQHDEVFLANVPKDPAVLFNHLDWKTKRLGKIAYENGEKVDRKLPVFVKRKEMTEKHPHLLKVLE